MHILETGEYGLLLKVAGTWDCETSDINPESVSELWLNQSAGWVVDDLEWLSEFENVQAVYLASCQTIDPFVFERLPRLACLSLNAATSGPLPSGVTRNLKKLSIRCFDCKQQLVDLPNVEELCLMECRGCKLEELRHPERLRRLILMNWSPPLLSCSKMPALERLDLRDLRTLEKLELTDCRALRVLRIDGCKRLSPQIASLAEARGLRELHLSSMGRLESIAFIRAFNNLTWLTIHGTTIEDGDLTHLLQLRSLEKLSITPRRHYNYSQVDLDRLFPWP